MNNLHVVSENQNTLILKSDEIKIYEDIQIILGIALAIIVSLGDAGFMSPLTMGSCVIGLVTITAMTRGIAELKKEKSKKSDCYSKVIGLISVISLIAMMVLGAFIVSDHVHPKTFATIILGIDLMSLAVKMVATRMCGSQKKRYSCF